MVRIALSLGVAAGMVAPYYNMGLVVIVFYLFIKLFRTPLTHKRVYLPPWVYLFTALCIYVIEQVTTILRQADVLYTPPFLNGVYELAIITLFIYTLLLQKEHVKQYYY